MGHSCENMYITWQSSCLFTSNTRSSMVCSCVAVYTTMLMKRIGLFEYEEYISLRTINDPNEGQVNRTIYNSSPTNGCLQI